MKVPVHKITVFSGRDAALAVHADTARVANHLAHHVFGGVILEAEPLRQLVVLPADRPLGDVVRPLVRCDRGWSVAVLGVEPADAAGDAAARARFARRPLLPRGDRFLYA